MNLRVFAVQKNGSTTDIGPALPDAVISPGAPNKRFLAAAGWPQERLIVAEGLRYLQWRTKYLAEQRPLPATGRRLLVVTGYLRAETEFQLGLLARAASAGGLATYANVLIKPHPSSPIGGMLPTPSAELPWQATSEPLDRLWKHADVVFLANSTSSAIEAAWLGLPIILTASIDSLNLSPMVDFSDASFVDGVETLVNELTEPRRIKMAEDYYLLEPDLPRWKDLLRARDA